MRDPISYERSRGIYQARSRPNSRGPGNEIIANYKSGGIVQLSAQRPLVVGAILVVALLAFEVFNFDTTRYALENLLGAVSFAGLGWATILAIAFCAIDFAGLAYLFSPDRFQKESKEVWYLMGAWLLGATMNAMMTWWAVSLSLLNHQQIGNEVLSRDQLLYSVPIFVALLVWLTRILFISAFSVAGNHLFQENREDLSKTHTQATMKPAQLNRSSRRPSANVIHHTSDELPAFLQGRHAPPGIGAPVSDNHYHYNEAAPEPLPVSNRPPSPQQSNEPIRPYNQRSGPPMPNTRSRIPAGVQARSRR